LARLKCFDSGGGSACNTTFIDFVGGLPVCQGFRIGDLCAASRLDESGPEVSDKCISLEVLEPAIRDRPLT